MIRVPPDYPSGLARTAIWTAPLAGVLKLVGNLLGTFDSVGYGMTQAHEASVAAGSGYLVGQLVGSVLPTALTPLWVFALVVYAAPRIRLRRTLTAAVVAWTLGAGFAIAALGVVTYAIPALAHAHYAGDPGAMNLADSFFGWPRVAMFLPALLVPVGSILFAVAAWSRTAIPRTCLTGLAAGAILISAPGPFHLLHWLGGILTLVTGAWVAVILRRDTAPLAT